MKRRITLATTAALVMVATTTAVALNVSVHRLTTDDTEPVAVTTEADATDPITMVVEVSETTTSTTTNPVETEGARLPAPVQAVQREPAAPAYVPIPVTSEVQAPAVPPPTTTAAAATEYLTFSAGPGGSVVIADHGESLSFWAAYPENGWQYRVEGSTGREIEIKYFQEGYDEGKFIARLEDGQVTTVVEGFAVDRDEEDPPEGESEEGDDD